MQGREKMGYEIEYLSEEELDFIWQWGTIASKVPGRKWDKQQGRLLHDIWELRESGKVAQEDREETRMFDGNGQEVDMVVNDIMRRGAQSSAVAGDGLIEGGNPRVDASVIDAGQGMQWRERED